MMPTRNRARDLHRGIRNALGQAGVELELIVSDNASSDKTEAICKEAAAGDPRIRFFRQDRLLGLYEHHNFCLEKARGKYLGFFHDHDLHVPDFTQRCIQLMENHPRVGLVGADWRMEDETGEFLGERRFRVPDVELGRNYLERTIRSGRSSVAIPGALMRREAAGKCRFEGAKGFGDFKLWFRIAEDWNIGHFREILWTMRQSPNAQSATTILQMTADYLINIEAYLNDLQTRKPSEKSWVEARKKDARRFVFWSLICEKIIQSGGTVKRRPSQTLFQIYGYQLSSTEIKELHARLREFAPPGIAFLLRFLSKKPSSGFFEKILSLFLGFPELSRRILRLN